MSRRIRRAARAEPHEGAGREACGRCGLPLLDPWGAETHVRLVDGSWVVSVSFQGLGDTVVGIPGHPFDRTARARPGDRRAPEWVLA